MTLRTLLTAGTFALATVSLASAKTYDITVPAPTKVGDTELKPGQYKLKVEGSQAVFTDSHDKSVTVPAKVENAEKKFGYTRLETTSQNGMDTMQAIDLGDSNSRVTIGH
jgi:hypothetical protein